MKRTTYECDHCKRKSSIHMPKFKCEFGRPLGHNHPLPNVETGHLCPECEADWCNEFFNAVVKYGGSSMLTTPAQPPSTPTNTDEHNTDNQTR